MQETLSVDRIHLKEIVKQSETIQKPQKETKSLFFP